MRTRAEHAANPHGGIPRTVGEEDLAGFTAGQFLDVLKALTAILTLPPSAADRVDALVVASARANSGGSATRSAPGRRTPACVTSW
ncbi:hypothetical protein [Micromonospora sp. C31]|uniref:hypothetical protein n=1 Tax=Micromonospora sp. C31 TaxID=2824876 RepID=UPI0027DAD4A4|nr:hypothetical protein [Micromonospora sp. C31]